MVNKRKTKKTNETIAYLHGRRIVPGDDDARILGVCK